MLCTDVCVVYSLYYYSLHTICKRVMYPTGATGMYNANTDTIFMKLRFLVVSLRSTYTYKRCKLLL
jgi:hypothetical protein